MVYRNKTYVCFDGDTDMFYYRLMCAWKQNEGINFNFYNAHDLNSARDTSTEESIKRQLRERLKNSKVFIVLIGEKTRNLYKFVRWEIEQALSLEMPRVAVNLNNRRCLDVSRCPPIIRNQLAIHVSFHARIVQYALENWSQEHTGYKEQGQIEPYYYQRQIYENLEL